MAVIELTDEQAAALGARAAEEGLTLQAWLQKLAGEGPASRKSRYSLAELLRQCDTSAPLSEEDEEWLNASPIGREAD